MKTKYIILTLFISALSISSSIAQSYNNAIGLRVGSSNGLTFKHFVGQTDAVEIILGTRWRGFQVTGLYERHKTISGNEQFKFYYGAGAHIASWNDNKKNPWFDKNDKNDNVVVGLDGILGIEYAFKEVPIVLSLDWKPEFNFYGYNGVWVGDAGLSVRYYW
jgi:hypothetical protein